MFCSAVFDRPELFHVSIMKIVSAISYQNLRFLTGDLLTVCEQWLYVTCVFRVRDFFSNPESRFIVHESEEILHVTFDLQEQLVGSPSVRDLWRYFVYVFCH